MPNYCMYTMMHVHKHNIHTHTQHAYTHSHKDHYLLTTLMVDSHEVEEEQIKQTHTECLLFSLVLLVVANEQLKQHTLCLSLLFILNAFHLPYSMICVHDNNYCILLQF